MEHRFTREKASITDSGHIVGYGAVYYDGTPGSEYRLAKDYIERIRPGAFDNAIGRDDVRGLFNHDPNFVLGRTKSGTMKLSTDSRGFLYDIDPPDTPLAQTARENVRRGDVDGSSFSFIVVGQEFRTEGGTDIREITDVELFDTGPVTFPAYEATTAQVRSIGGDDAFDARNKWRASQAQAAHARRARELRLKELAEDL